MPALAADQVSLEEVLVVRGEPLTEQQLWSLLCLSSEALQDVFSSGHEVGKSCGLITITPETLLLCFSGQVKFPLNTVNYNRSFTAPETYARKHSLTGSALEKICVYSLGMTLYYAAEYKVPVGKPVSISDSLEAVLLSMCEEAAQLRYSLVQVIKECHKRLGRRGYRKILTSLVKSVLGNEVSVIENNLALGFPQADSKLFVNGDSYSPTNVRLDITSPRNLPSPPPIPTSSRGLPTGAEFVGSNNRQEQTPNDLERSLQTINQVPHVLDKYKKQIEKSRAERARQSSENMGATLEKFKAQSVEMLPLTKRLWNQPESPNSNYSATQDGKDPAFYDSNEKGYSEGPAPGLQQNGRHRPDLISSTDFRRLRRYGSEGSFTDTSSFMSGPHSLFSDGRSSSAVSLTQGSYAPECYINDGYESDLYMRSFGSSRLSQLSKPFSSSSDPSPRTAKKQVSVNSAPFSDEVDVGHIDQLQYSSMPNLYKEPSASESTATGSKTKLKTFFGPEFVQISQDPDKSIITIANRKGGQLPQGRKMVTVVLLNGQRLQIMVETSGKTQALFDQVVKYLGITEKIFFGLTQLQEEEHVFLDLDVKLSKYAPVKWKEEKKGTNINFTLFFRVKFYVEHVSLLTQSKTRHQYYLQLRKDILEARVHCHEEASFILAGLALQAEIGDYDDSLGQNYFMAEHFLPQRVLVKLPVNLPYEHLPEIHVNFMGLSEEHAELEFLKEAQKLPEYGVHFYKVSTSKKSVGQDKWLGICVRGVTVYEACGHVKTPVQRNSWQMTKKLSFQKKKFFIEPRTIESGSSSASKLTFYTKHYKKAKYLLQLCTAFHRFQMKMKSRLAAVEQEVAHEISNEVVQIQNGAQQPNKRFPFERTQSAPESNSVYRTRREARNLKRFYSEKNDNTDMHPSDRETVKRQVSSASERLSLASSEEGSDIHQQSPKNDYRMLSRRTGTLLRQSTIDHSFERSVDVPYVIDASVTSQALAASEPDRNMLGNEVGKDIARSPDREIKVIKLQKEEGKGIGITVVGGENSKKLDFGIYIKSITEGSPAWNDGRLKAGDRILAVNGQSLEQITHEDAVGLLKNSPPRVELVVSQSPHNASSIDLTSAPSPTKYSIEEPESLEVKSLPTDRDDSLSDTLIDSQEKTLEQLPSSEEDHEDKLDNTLIPQVENAVEVDGGQNNNLEQQASSLSFPSEDEPVTMVSKSISSLAAQYERFPSPLNREVVDETKPRPSHKEQEFADSRLSFDIKDKYIQPEHIVNDESLESTYFPETHPSTSEAVLATPAAALKPEIKQENLSVPTRPLVESKRGYDTGLSDMVLLEGTGGRPGNENPTDKPFVVNLEKKDGSLGLSVTGGINTSVRLGGIYVKSLYPNGPADLDGRIRVGDRILDVNGVSLVGVTHKQAVETIKRAPSNTRLTIDRSVPVNISSRSAKHARPLATDEPFIVELVKSVGGLGLSLVGGTDSEPEHGGLLRIKKMFPGQPAAICGKLQLGDIVQEVNGKSLQGVTHQEAINLIRISGPIVRLMVKREPSSIPTSLLSRSSSNASDVDPAQILAEIQNKLRQDEDGTSEEYSRRTLSLTPKSSVGSNSSAALIVSSSPIVVEEFALQLQSSPVANCDQIDTGVPQSVDSRETNNSKLYLHQFQKPKDDAFATTHPLSSKRISQSEILTQENQAATVAGESTGVTDSNNEDELENTEESSDTESESEEMLDNETSFGGLDNEQNNEPLDSLTDRDKPSIVDLPNNQLPAVSEDEANNSLTTAEEIIEIELIKGSGGLGFTLAGGADTTGGCFVRDVIGDPAKADGRLRKRDQIIKVDGIDITGLKHMDAVNVLRSTEKRVKLVVLRRPETVVSYGQSGVVETVNLTRTSRGRIGLIIKESEDARIYVDDVVPGEPAAVEGNLKNGDLILEINGQKLHGAGFLAARQCLDAARPVVRLMVERKIRIVESKYAASNGQVSESVSSAVDGVQNHGFSGDTDSEEEEEQHLDTQQENVIVVELKKGDRGFGFSLVAATTNVPEAQGIFIKTISPGSVAEKDGRMKVGDQLLKVNDEDVRGMSHARVINILRKITGTVRLHLSRPSDSSLELRSSTLPRQSETVTRSNSSTQLSTTHHLVEDRKGWLTRKHSESIDLDITLEDTSSSKSLTSSDCVKDEDDVTVLLNALSKENLGLQNKPSPVQRRDTDTVLTSLLRSAEPPLSGSDSLPPVDFSDSDPDYPPDSSSEDLQERGGTNPSDWASAEDSFPEDTVKRKRPSSEESDITTRNRLSASSSTDSIDIVDDSDLDVFDMLRDNSQIVIQAINESSRQTPVKSNLKSPRKNEPYMNLWRDENAVVPPPIPTTPIPSDDELQVRERKPSKDFIVKSQVENGDLVQEIPVLPPKRGSYKQNSCDDVIGSHTRDPLIQVVSGGRYSGNKLRTLINSLQGKLESNLAIEEFRDLRNVRAVDGCDTAKKDSNRDKNRYRNVLPFDKTRVKLCCEGQADYINASHIKVRVGNDTYSYIACQGPLPNTTADFWQMVWEQKAQVIGMLTLEIESGKVKCHRYWPENQDEPLPVGENFEVSLRSKKVTEAYIERTFTLRSLKDGASMDVIHLNFTRWPDHGVPKCSKELVRFIQHMRFLPCIGPMVVHCSAGVGRTGALIAVDVALGHMEKDLPFDINKTIRHLRGQRPGMIQTKEQYIFCYQACLDVLRSLDN